MSSVKSTQPPLQALLHLLLLNSLPNSPCVADVICESSNGACFDHRRRRRRIILLSLLDFVDGGRGGLLFVRLSADHRPGDGQVADEREQDLRDIEWNLIELVALTLVQVLRGLIKTSQIWHDNSATLLRLQISNTFYS